MKYRCKKCHEIYEEMPMECDFDCCTEFEEVDICENCGEYEVVFGKYCEECIKKNFKPHIGTEYIKYLDEKRLQWGLEPFYQKEFEYFLKNETEKFLWEYCSSNLEGLGEFIFEISLKRGGLICSDS